MSEPRLCPNPDLDCDACVDEFVAEHPGVEVFRHTYHLFCDCPFIAWSDDLPDTCVGCGERRDMYAEWQHFWAGRPKRGVAA